MTLSIHDLQRPQNVPTITSLISPMKRLRPLVALFAALGLFLTASLAQGTAAAGNPTAELEALVGKIQEKLRAGQKTPEALAPDIAAFDTLLARHSDQKTDEVAQILVMKLSLYLEIFEDFATAATLTRQLKADFPQTGPGREAERLLEAIEARANLQTTRAKLVGSAAPALNFTWASRDGLKTLNDLKGKVVILDFWATWCGPCITSFPEIAALVERYKGHDVEVVGVTSLQGRVMNLEATPVDVRGNPAREYELMSAFMKKHNVTWTVAFSQEQVFNPEYAIEGIPHMAIIAPDGTLRHTALHPSDPNINVGNLVDTLLKEFSLKTPKA